jgi:UDP-2,4-diacetamido-2,4,6-trideoxy-beta-L-altropyranose hydrolase
MPGSLFIRADATERIGTGHVMRCLALAQSWQRSGGKALFAQIESTPAIERRLQTEGFPIVSIEAEPGSAEDARATVRLAREQGADWIVADGYHFDAEYQRHFKENELRLLLIDDYGHAEHYWADYVLNQNLSADPKLYRSRESDSHLLLGTRYVLLRRDFEKWRNWKREIPAVAHKVLVTLGGADPENVTAKIIQALTSLRDVEVVVVAGGSNPHLEKLRTAISHLPPAIRLVVDVTNMPDLMAWADIAIAAGGTTSWELAFMGVPSLMFILAENQRGLVDALADEKVVRKTSMESLAGDLRALQSDAAARKAMSERGRKLVDGLGVSRVVSHLRAAKLRLRPVRAEDCRQIWEWANEAEARSASFSQEPIPWEDHVKWFSARVDSPSCLFYVATNSGENPVGQIRFDVEADEAVLSVSLAKEARGHGYGSPLIVQGAQRCFADSRVDLIRAYVKPTNETSIHAFEKTDFVPAKSVEVRGQTMRQFVLERHVAS